MLDHYHFEWISSYCDGHIYIENCMQGSYWSESAVEWNSIALLGEWFNGWLHKMGYVTHWWWLLWLLFWCPIVLFKSFQLTWRSGASRWNLLAPDFQVSFNDMNGIIGCQYSSQNNDCHLAGYSIIIPSHINDVIHHIIPNRSGSVSYATHLSITI